MRNSDFHPAVRLAMIGAHAVYRKHKHHIDRKVRYSWDTDEGMCQVASIELKSRKAWYYTIEVYANTEEAVYNIGTYVTYSSKRSKLIKVTLVHFSDPSQNSLLDAIECEIVRLIDDSQRPDS